MEQSWRISVHFFKQSLDQAIVIKVSLNCFLFFKWMHYHVVSNTVAKMFLEFKTSNDILFLSKHKTASQCYSRITV